MRRASAITLFVALGSAPAFAVNSTLTDFEPAGFITGGSVQALAPDGTTISPIVSGTNPDAIAWSVRVAGTDEEVVDLGADPHGKVWRMSPAVDMGNLQTSPHSPQSGGFSGESTAIDDFGTESTTSSTFYSSMDFRSVTGAPQTDLSLSVSSACGDDCRQSFVRFVDDGVNGIDLTVFETGAGGFSEFIGIDLDLDLSYTDWHTLVMTVEFVDGINVDGTGNDIVQYFVDGVLVHTGTSWETGYLISTSSVRGIDRLRWANSGTVAINPGTAGAGFYFDNVFVSDGPPPGCLDLVAPDVCTGPGGSVVVDVTLSDAAVDVVGAQLFLEYDSTVLDFVSIEPGDAPFTEEIFESVDESSPTGTIDYAVGVMLPAVMGASDGVVARITFDALGSACDTSGLVSFRTNTPPTTATDSDGLEVPMTLKDLNAITVDVDPPSITCPADTVVECGSIPSPSLGMVYSTLATQDGWSSLTNNYAQPDTFPVTTLGFDQPDRGESVIDEVSRTGQQCWHLKRGYDSPGSGTPYSPQLAVNAGQPSSGAGADTFYASFWFRAADASGDGSRVAITGGNPAGNDRSSNYFEIENMADGSGVTVRTFEGIIGSGFDGNFLELANGLSTNDWHQIEMIGSFVDGTYNDSWTYIIDGGSPIVADAYFETARDNLGFTYEMTNRLKFRPRHANYDASFSGFYFDDVEYRSYNAAAPGTTLGLYSTGFEAGAGVATATDNCDADPAISSSDVEDLSGCGESGTITRTWTATDECGNTATCEQTITIVDTTGPIVVAPPDITVNADAGECSAIVPSLGTATATDVCDNGPAVHTRGVVINEIRIDQPGGDDDEYFELAGPAGASLDGLTYIVIGDGAGGTSGVIESVTDLDGNSLNGAGLFTVAEGSFTLGVADLTDTLGFENSDNVTHLLVSGFTGSNGDDLDDEDDGVLDTLPWDSIVDSVALIEDLGSGEQVYSSTHVGPDGTFVPGQVYRCTPSGDWNIGGFSLGSDDTPTAANPTCDGPIITFFMRSDGLGLNDPYPATGFGGPITVTWAAEDDCGNVGFADQLVTVNPVNELVVDVELQNVDPGPFTRCITFELWLCPDSIPAATVPVEMTFSGGIASGTIEVPCGLYECITARDTLHTLRRTDEDDFGISGPLYVANFTETGGGPDDDSLIGGNLNDDSFIDILDFGVFVADFSPVFPGNHGGVPDTDCSTAFPHADVSGDPDGLVDLADFTFVQQNFLAINDDNCCGAALLMAGPERQRPRDSISVLELRRTGLGRLRRADLNRDGRVDQLDMVEFMNGARP